MKKYKTKKYKIIQFLLILGMIFSLSACSKKDCNIHLDESFNNTYNVKENTIEQIENKIVENKKNDILYNYELTSKENKKLKKEYLKSIKDDEIIIKEINFMNTGTAGLLDSINMYEVKYIYKDSKNEKIKEKENENENEENMIVEYFIFYAEYDDEYETYVKNISKEELDLRFDLENYIETYDNKYTACAIVSFLEYKERIN